MMGVQTDEQPATRQRPSGAVLLPWLLALGLAAAYCAVSLGRLYRYETRSWDLAIFEQVVHGYAELAGPIVDVQGPDANFFGDHFSPALAVLAPLYRVAPHTETLLIAQAFLVAGSVLIVTRLAVRHVGFAAGMGIGLAYGLSWGIQSAVDFDFHEVALAVPLLALSGAAYVDRDWGRTALWAFPLVLVKEDLALTSAAIGVVLVLRGARRWGAALLIASVLAFVAATVVIIPAVNADGVYRFWPESDGSDGVLATLLHLPLDLVWPAEKLETLLLVLAVGVLLVLRSPWMLVAGPNLAVRFLSDNPYYWSTEWHYSLTTMTVVFVALVDALVLVRERGPDRLRAYASHVPVAAVAVALVLCLQFPFRGLFDPSTYDGGQRAMDARAVLARVPDDASVASDLSLLSDLVGDRDVYWVGSDTGGIRPEFVLLEGARTREGQVIPGTEYAGAVFGGGWRSVDVAGPFELLRRVA
jgi:uncharacterized membrane protein